MNKLCKACLAKTAGLSFLELLLMLKLFKSSKNCAAQICIHSVSLLRGNYMRHVCAQEAVWFILKVTAMQN